MTTKQMQDAIIRQYGFEHPATIWFFECCETNNGDEFLNAVCFEWAINWDEDENM